MKSIAKMLVLLISLILLIIGSFFLIFSQGLVGSLIWAVLFTLFCTLLFTVGIRGLTKGNARVFKIRNPSEAIGALLFSSILFASVLVITAANSFVLYTAEGSRLQYEEKLRVLSSSFFQGPLQEELLLEEKNGIAYYYAEENKNEIKKMDLLLMEQRKKLNAFFGTRDTGGLAIEFHANYETMGKYAGMEGVSGFYNLLNRTIHLVPDDPIWESVLVHEYVHYQSHLFAEENGLSVSRIPHWFEEGLADYFAEGNNNWFDMTTLEMVDFHSLDAQEDFDAAATGDFDPYVQSHLAVRALVEDYGESVILELLGSETADEFYILFEETTGQEIGEFQKIFMADMLKEQQTMEGHYEQLYELMETRNYGEAEKLLEAIKKNGDEYEVEEAYWIISDIYIQHGLFEKAYLLLEQKLAQDESLYVIDDLLMMAELQLLENPEKAIHLVLKAQEEAKKEEEVDYYEFEVLISAYEKINSTDALSGFKMLLEADLFYNGAILEKLEYKLKKQFPEKF